MNTAAVLREVASFIDANPHMHLSTVNTFVEAVNFRVETVRDFDQARDSIQAWFHVGRPIYRDHDGLEIATWRTHVGTVWLYGRKDMPMTED